MRTSIDTITGKMMDLTTYILGENPVKCVKMNVQGKPAILALAERPWLIYAYDNKQIISPLSYPHLDIAVSVRNPANPHTAVSRGSGASHFIGNGSRLVQVSLVSCRHRTGGANFVACHLGHHLAGCGIWSATTAF